jgi:hypothetical protein
MKNIAQAIIKVMAEVKGMEKNSKVGSGNSAYDGTKDQDVKEVFNEVMARNGLCILPMDIKETTQIDRWDEVDQWSKETPKATKQKQSVFTKVTVKYLLLHTSGESIELMGYGHGIDPQDKGAGKATTYALKNCLLYTFLTPVGKIDDTDLKHSNEIETPKKPAVIVDKERLETRLKSCENVPDIKSMFAKFTDNEKAEIKPRYVEIATALNDKLTLKTA